MEKAVKRMQYVSSDEQLRYLFDMQLKSELDYGSAMAANFSKGHAEGHAEGVKVMALKLKKEAVLSVEKIAELSGLTVEEIEKL